MQLRDNTQGAVFDYCIKKLIRHFGMHARQIVVELFESLRQTKYSQIVTHPQERLSESEILSFHFAIQKLIAGEPLQYVTGRAHFYRRILRVNKHVLIPRPETEELCERILSDTDANFTGRVLDACTGSGCIAITLQLERLNSTVFAFDISEAALEVARSNNDQLAGKVDFFKADALQPETLPKTKWDIIVSNPPYVHYSEISDLDVNVKDYEPHLALFAPSEDVFAFYRSLVEYAVQSLCINGRLYFEIHNKGGSQIAQILQDAGLQSVEILNDLSGKERFAKAIKR
jgi:release factor glutamine methyltransferase